jgi:hypothetical protein
LSIPARIKKIRRIKFIQFLIIIKVKSSWNKVLIWKDHQAVTKVRLSHFKS